MCKIEQTAEGYKVVVGQREVTVNSVRLGDFVRLKRMVQAWKLGESIQILAIWADQWLSK